MARGKRLGRFWWVGVILVIIAVSLLFKVIDWYASPHTFRLVAHYSAKGTLAEPVDPKQVDSAYREFLEEGEPAVFTEAGLFLFEQGSKVYQADQQQAVVAFRDWRGRRRWAVTLPKCASRDIFASPDGRYLAAVCTDGAGLYQVWHDGKSLYICEPDGYDGSPSYLIDNRGRFFIWQDDSLTVVDDGKVIASNPKLPRTVQTKTTCVNYQLAPDGTTMAGMVYSLDFPVDIYERAGSSPPAIPKPSLDYVSLTIRGSKVVATHRLYKNITIEGNWSFLLGGDLLCTDGTILTRNGQQRSHGAGWIPLEPLIGDGSVHLWHGEAMTEVRLPSPVTIGSGAPLPSFTPHFRVILPRTGHSWLLPQQVLVTVNSSSDRFDISASGDGRYALAVTYHDQYPPTMTGRLARACNGIKALRKLFTRVPKDYAQFMLFDQAGKQRAQMICPVTDAAYDTVPVLKVEKQKYAMVSCALSQDGKNLVVLAQSVTGHDREYLHFAW